MACTTVLVGKKANIAGSTISFILEKRLYYV